MTKSEEVAGEVELERRRRCEEDLEEITRRARRRRANVGKFQSAIFF